MITKKFYDYHPCGTPLYSYELSGEGIMSFSVLDYGATLHKILVKDKDGIIRDVIGGFDKVTDYMDSGEYQGATIGRVCNRLKNAEYILNGVKYNTYKNEGNNVCHAGRFGFNAKIWTVEELDDNREPALRMTYTSPDGEEGFPGNLKVTVTYKLTTSNGVSIHYEAETDKTTIVNLTNHAYFNMNGYDNGNMENHYIRMNTDKFNETDVELIPTGNFTDVTGTPFDMRKPRLMKDVLFGDNDKIRELGGLDTNFIMNDYDGTVKHQADFYSPETGIGMKVLTNQTSILVYTSNRIKATEPNMKSNVKQIPHFGACFEASLMPDAINHAHFDNTVLNPGEKYDKTTIFEFTNNIELLNL